MINPIDRKEQPVKLIILSIILSIAVVILYDHTSSIIIFLHFLLPRITLFKFSLPTSLGNTLYIHPPEEGRLGRFNVRFSEDGGHLNRTRVEGRSAIVAEKGCSNGSDD